MQPADNALAKAKLAIQAAKATEVSDATGTHYYALLSIANIHANISMAESLERLADKFAPVPREERRPGEGGYA